MWCSVVSMTVLYACEGSLQPSEQHMMLALHKLRYGGLVQSKECAPANKILPDNKQQCKVTLMPTRCCRFPASQDPKVFAAQQTLVEAWSIIEDAYVDAQFGGHQWEDELSNALVATYAAEDGDGAYKQISNMLSKLGDPFTRIVPASCVSLFPLASQPSEMEELIARRTATGVIW